MSDVSTAHPRPPWRGHRSAYHSRKFLFAAFFAGVGTLLCAAGMLTGSEWVTLATLILTIYGAADVADKRLNQPKT
jgi:hypothetical protein